MYTFTVILFSLLPPAFLFAVAFVEGRKDVPSPMFVLGWAVLIGYTFKGLYLAYTLHSPASHRLSHLGESTMGLGTIATFFSLCLVIFGYVITSNKRLKRPKQKIKIGRFTSGLLYFGMFWGSVALMLAFFTRMGFWSQLASLRFTSKKYLVLENGQETSLGFLTIGGDFLLIFALYYFVFKNKIRNLNPYILIVGFLFLTYFISSRRNAAILMIIAYLLVMGVKKARQRWGGRWKKYFLMGGMLLILSFASVIRDAGRVGASINEISASQAIEVTMGHAMYGSYFMDPAKMGGIIGQTSERNLYQLGSSYYAVIFAPIPRVWWNEKPPIRNSYFVSHEVLRVPSTAGVPPSGLAELFLNFGWIGLVLGSAFFGIFLKLILNAYTHSENKNLARIPYAMLMLCSVLFLLADFAMAFLFAIRYGIAIFVCSSFWAWRQRQSDKIA